MISHRQLSPVRGAHSPDQALLPGSAAGPAMGRSHLPGVLCFHTRLQMRDRVLFLVRGSRFPCPRVPDAGLLVALWAAGPLSLTGIGVPRGIQNNRRGALECARVWGWLQSAKIPRPCGFGLGNTALGRNRGVPSPAGGLHPSTLLSEDTQTSRPLPFPLLQPPPTAPGTPARGFGGHGAL